MRREAAALLMALACTVAGAQQIPSAADWQEADTPPPPPLNTQRLVSLDMGTGTELRWGVDPASIRIGPDRVIRYVVVGQSQGGAVNAYYEGLRCDSAQVRVYARHARDGDWVAANAGWIPLQGTSATHHSLRFARDGACMGQGPNRSAQQIVRDLAQSADLRFRNETR
ncbi:MAG: hypothetical protein NVS2B4_17020 [Ramlibacter sp.]